MKSCQTCAGEEYASDIPYAKNQAGAVLLRLNSFAATDRHGRVLACECYGSSSQPQVRVRVDPAVLQGLDRLDDGAEVFVAGVDAAVVEQVARGVGVVDAQVQLT